jgi:dipeptidyl aminopeptidase/acylaminoacyl peptidase
VSFNPRTSETSPARPSVRHSLHPCLSPDGKLLAAVVIDEDGYPHAVQRPLATPDGVGAGPERTVPIPTPGPVRNVAYSHDGHWIACEVGPDGGEREEIWLFTTDPDDQSAVNPFEFTDATVQIVCWDGVELALTAIDDSGLAEGRVLSAVTQDVRVVDRRVGGELVHVRDGVALFRVGSRGHRELLRVDVGGAWWPLLPPDPGSTTDAGVVLDAGHESGVMRALVRSDHHGERFRLLDVRVGPDGTDVRELAARADADLDEFSVSRDGSTATLLWNHDGRSRIQILDLRYGEPRELPAPRLPKVVVTSPSLTADGRLLTFCVQGPEFPPRVVLWDVAHGTWTGDEPGANLSPEDPRPPIGAPGPLARYSAEPKGETAAPDPQADEADSRPLTVLVDAGSATFVPELVRYPARDGLELTAWVYCCGDEPAPTMVYFHGGPEGQSRPSYNNVLRQAVDAGYTVVAPNVRGSSGQGRAFSHADERYSRLSAIDDVADTVAYLVKTGISDPEKMVVSGRSYGGYLTLATLVRHPELWRGAIAACGMSDLETFYRDTEPWIAVAALPKYGHPLQERELLQELSPIHGLGEVVVPVLFVHGAHDTNVPVNETRQAIAVLESNGVGTDLLLFEDEGHEFVKRANRHRLGDRVVAFLEEVLG